MILGSYAHPKAFCDREARLDEYGVNAVFIHGKSIDQETFDRAKDAKSSLSSPHSMADTMTTSSGIRKLIRWTTRGIRQPRPRDFWVRVPPIRDFANTG